MMYYNPANWYWFVAGSTSQVYSSARGIYVPVTDSIYTGWLAAGGHATRIVSEEELLGVLAENSVAVPAQFQLGLVAYAQKKQAALAAGGVAINANASGAALKVFCATDAASLGQLTGLYLLAQTNSQLTAPWVNGSTSITLTAAQILTMAPLVAMFVQETYVTLAAVLAAIAGGTITTAAQIDAAAWPANS